MRWLSHNDTRDARLLPFLVRLCVMAARAMNGKRARPLNKIIDISTTILFYAPVLMLVYGYVGRECVRYTVKGMRERLSK